MKRYLYIIAYLLLAILSLSAQNKDKKTSNIKKVDKFIHAWYIDEQLGVADTIQIDTTYINFNEKSVIRNWSIANSHNANYGSPLQSKIYFERAKRSDFIFENAYKPYLSDIESTLFYDVNFPLTNLTYLTGGPFGQKEEQVKFMFTTGPSKKINSALNMDFIHAVGMFNNQAAKRFAGSLNGRYTGERYAANALVYLNNHSNFENGGLTNLTMLNNPDVDVRTKDMPTALNAFSNFKKNGLLFNQSYAIGFQREIKDSIANREESADLDSVRFEFVPVTRFGHTMKVEEMRKRYHEPTMNLNFYENNFDSISKAANDTAAIRSITNLVSINIAEEFNKWLKFGLTAYAENEIQQFAYRPDTLIQHTVKSNTRIGGVLSKTQGNNFRYNFLGDIYIAGYKLGEFRLEGNMYAKLKLLNEVIELQADAYVKNEEPSFFLQNYYSSHFRWENNFGKTYRTYLGGVLRLQKSRTKLNIGLENITNSIYFDEKGEPTQHDGNIQILATDLQQDIKLGKIYLENHVIYQLSSNKDVVPLPSFALFHNLYYADKWFVDLYPQFGVSVRYHSKYLAPSYMPAIGQFYNQKEVMIGNYPEINAYANFHIKQARIFVEYSNIGKYLFSDWGFSMPNYPINPPMLKAGVSWNFYN